MTKGKKVALLGNMNNNFFSLARYLRDADYDAHLFIFPFDPEHFLPEADAYDSNYKDYVHTLSWGNAFDLITTPVDKVRQDIGGYDFYIGCGTAPAYLTKAGIRLDMFIPYGADLYELPFFRLVRPHKLYHYYIFTRLQQQGIGAAKSAVLADTSDMLNKPLMKMGFKGHRLTSSCPMIYAQQYLPDKISEAYPLSKYYPAFSKIRQQFDLVIFHNSRHCWKNEPPLHLKHNDMLFKGLASSLKNTPGLRIAVITFEYGNDVQASKDLIRELGIESNVFWFPLMPRKELMIGMSLSDIVAGEFINSWFTYGVVFEAMVLAKPVMHYRNDALYPDFDLFPIINTKDAGDVSRAITHYAKNKSQLPQIGESGRAWFMRNVVDRSVNAITEILSDRSSG